MIKYCKNFYTILILLQFQLLSMSQIITQRDLTSTLMLLVKENQYDALKNLLQNYAVNVNFDNDRPLKTAVSKGFAEVAHHLLAYGADGTIDNGWPLKCACCKGFDKIVANLLQTTAYTSEAKDLALISVIHDLPRNTPEIARLLCDPEIGNFESYDASTRRRKFQECVFKKSQTDKSFSFEIFYATAWFLKLNPGLISIPLKYNDREDEVADFYKHAQQYLPLFVEISRTCKNYSIHELRDIFLQQIHSHASSRVEQGINDKPDSADEDNGWESLCVDQ